MEKTKEIKCRKCGNIEIIVVEDESKLGPGGYKLINTFFCKDCEHLTTLDSVRQKMICGTCRSSNLTKFFPETKIKCRKCGTHGYGGISF